MTANEALKQLKALGTEKVRAQNAKSGAADIAAEGTSRPSGSGRVLTGSMSPRKAERTAP